MKKYAFLLCTVLLFAACNKSKSFIIDGHITETEGSTLYFEQTATSGNILLDSAMLKADGGFRFKQKSPMYPDIYQLRLNGKRFVFAVDSTEHITITATGETFALPEEIAGSPETELIIKLRNSLINNDIEKHRELQKEVILTDPKSTVAYFALHQTKNGEYILSPYNADDLICYRAVATAFHVFMPEYYRSKALYSQVLNIINAEKNNITNAQMRKFIEDSPNAFLEISLPDENGEICNLSAHKGRYTVLDFSAVSAEWSTAYIFQLKEIYNKYHNKGLDIYQVSGDPNRIVWQQSANNLPWTTVRSENGISDNCFTTYNVLALPTIFLLDKQGLVLGRYNTFKDLGDKIEECLR